MNKYLKMRVAFLIATIGLVILGLVLTFIANAKVKDFRSEAIDLLKLNNNGAAIEDLAKTSSTSSMIAVVLVVVGALFFYIFALIYIFSKNPKTQGRKWPYITMLVLGALFVLVKLAWTLPTYMKSEPMTLEGSIHTEANLKLVSDLYTSSYQGSLVAITLIAAVCSLAVIGFHIVQLVLIKKARDNSDIQYSEQIRNFQQHQPKNNDLP